MEQEPDTSAMHVLTVDQCWQRLRSVSVARLAVIADGKPAIFPINYTVDHGTLVFRSAPGTKLKAALAGPSVALETDGVDTPSGTAWSVVISGLASEVVRTEELLDTFTLYLFPWERSPKEHFVRIVPDSVTGRQFNIAAPSHWWATQDHGPTSAVE